MPWPPFFDKIEFYKNFFVDNNIDVVLQPFVGIYNGKQYPENYSDKEKKILHLFNRTGNKEVLNFKLKED